MNHPLAVFAMVLGITFAVAFVLVWFPYGFIVGDLSINPFDWSQVRRVILLVIWFFELALIGLSASS